MEIGDWLRSLGRGKYEAAFRENDIDETVLPNLTAEDLKELGVTALGTTSGAFVCQNEGDRKGYRSSVFCRYCLGRGD
jgi:SAM domain (Sterile alpha motif)